MREVAPAVAPARQHRLADAGAEAGRDFRELEPGALEELDLDLLAEGHALAEGLEADLRRLQYYRLWRLVGDLNANA